MSHYNVYYKVANGTSDPIEVKGFEQAKLEAAKMLCESHNQDPSFSKLIKHVLHLDKPQSIVCEKGNINLEISSIL